MFRRAFLSSLFLIAVVLTTIYIFLIRIRSKDIPAYQEIMQASVELRSRKALEREPVHQQRQGVQKDIWRAHEGERLHVRLKSEKSHLILTQKKGKIDTVEELEKIECLMQEMIDTTASVQKLRELRAKEGTYYFPSHRFSADHIDLAFYQIPGTNLPPHLPIEQPLLTGYALSANLVDYDEETLTFSDHFQIEHPLGRLTGEKAMLTNFSLPMNKTPQNNPIHIQLENQILLETYNTPMPLSISSQRAHCDLPPKIISSTLHSQEVEFDENVVIKSPCGIVATGGHAILSAGSFLNFGSHQGGSSLNDPETPKMQKSTRAQYIYSQNRLTLYPSPPKSYCQLEYNENWIHAEKILFDLSQMEMICFSTQGYVAEKALSFSADSLRVSLSKHFQPTLLLLEGNVALHALYQNKKSFGLADSVTYKIEEKEWLLTAAPEKKVLFWQDELELSAPQLRITDAIEGIGDIHFLFNTEQKNQLLQIFSKYL